MMSRRPVNTRNGAQLCQLPEKCREARRRCHYLPTRMASHSLKTSCVREPTEQAEPPYCCQDQKLTVQPRYPQQTLTKAMDKNGHSSASHKQPQTANNPNTHHQQDGSENYGAFTQRNITEQRQPPNDHHTHPRDPQRTRESTAHVSGSTELEKGEWWGRGLPGEGYGAVRGRTRRWKGSGGPATP